jgi:hypothetical protein
MIVLDEQLAGRGIEALIRRWYRGNVCFINDMRPEIVIKDESIPVLLNEHDGATFVTINVKDFWERVSISDRFCVVCIEMPDSRVAGIPGMLRRLTNLSDFRSKRLRSGKVVRISSGMAIWYSREDSTQRTQVL